jgi:hypothetical protein
MNEIECKNCHEKKPEDQFGMMRTEYIKKDGTVRKTVKRRVICKKCSNERYHKKKQRQNDFVIAGIRCY